MTDTAEPNARLLHGRTFAGMRWDELAAVADVSPANLHLALWDPDAAAPGVVGRLLAATGHRTEPGRFLIPLGGEAAAAAVTAARSVLGENGLELGEAAREWVAGWTRAGFVAEGRVVGEGRPEPVPAIVAGLAAPMHARVGIRRARVRFDWDLALTGAGLRYAVSGMAAARLHSGRGSGEGAATILYVDDVELALEALGESENEERLARGVVRLLPAGNELGRARLVRGVPCVSAQLALIDSISAGQQ